MSGTIINLDEGLVSQGLKIAGRRINRVFLRAKQRLVATVIPAKERFDK